MLFINSPSSALCAKVSFMVTLNCKPGLNWFPVTRELSAEPSRDLGGWEWTLSRKLNHMTWSCERATFITGRIHSFMKTFWNPIIYNAESASWPCRLRKSCESSCAKLYVLVWHKGVGCRGSKDQTEGRNGGKKMWRLHGLDDWFYKAKSICLGKGPRGWKEQAV